MSKEDLLSLYDGSPANDSTGGCVLYYGLDEEVGLSILSAEEAAEEATASGAGAGGEGMVEESPVKDDYEMELIEDDEDELEVDDDYEMEAITSSEDEDEDAADEGKKKLKKGSTMVDEEED
ncbi:unnamed protein product, partial [Amoebophrya sp. A25]|eukprot:GSA25T00010448001.1